MLDLTTDELVELSGPFIAAGPQRLSCGHDLERGDRLYELHSASGHVGVVCSACCRDVAQRCSVVDTPTVW